MASAVLPTPDRSAGRAATRQIELARMSTTSFGRFTRVLPSRGGEKAWIEAAPRPAPIQGMPEVRDRAISIPRGFRKLNGSGIQIHGSRPVPRVSTTAEAAGGGLCKRESRSGGEIVGMIVAEPVLRV